MWRKLLLSHFPLFQTWLGPVLVQLCPEQFEETSANTTDKTDYLDTMVMQIMDNNILTNKSQTVIPLGMQGAGKTWTCRKLLRKLLKKCGTKKKNVAPGFYVFKKCHICVTKVPQIKTVRKSQTPILSFSQNTPQDIKMYTDIFSWQNQNYFERRYVKVFWAFDILINHEYH